jgi:RNA polymerase sigma factor (sigma-70 family)
MQQLSSEYKRIRNLQRLDYLAEEVRRFPHNSVERSRLLHYLLKDVLRSGKLYRPVNNSLVYLEDYEDAIQKTCLFVLRNIDKYDPAQSSFLTWFNVHLQYRVKDIYRSRNTRNIRVLQDSAHNPVYELPNPEPELDLDLIEVFEVFLQLIERDPEGELKHEENTLRGKKTHTGETYALTAQTYLLMRYRDNMTIQQIADELCIPRGSLQGSIKPKKWKELAYKYALMAKESISEGD